MVSPGNGAAAQSLHHQPGSSPQKNKSIPFNSMQTAALGGNRTQAWSAPLPVPALYFMLEITFTLEG